MNTTEIPPRPDLRSAADRVYDHVRGELLARRIAPHELLTEGQLADAVGVSRTPVREALLRLQGDGFLRLLPKRGALVLPVTAEEVSDVLETRRLLETYAVRKAIGGGHLGALVATLDEHVNTMRIAARNRDMSDYVLADRAFHAALVAATGNEVIKSFYALLRDRQLRMGVVNLLDPAGEGADATRMRTTIAEHEAIVAAIRAHTVRAAEAAVNSHLDQAAQLLARRV